MRTWEVGYFRGGREGQPGGRRRDQRGGDGVAGPARPSVWPMARGKEGQFGHVLNAPWVWLPLAAIFLLGLWDFRRWRKWVHLDLLVLLSFGVSQAFFNAAEIGVSVPLYYPPLVYLLARMLWVGFRGPGRLRTSGDGLRPSAPFWFLTIAVFALIGLRLDRQHRRLGSDRRRLRGRDRRRQDHRRRADLRRGVLPRGQPDRRHLRARQLLRLRPVRGGAAVERGAGTSCRPRTRRRSSSTWRRSSACSRSAGRWCGGGRGATPRRGRRCRRSRVTGVARGWSRGSRPTRRRTWSA